MCASADASASASSTIDGEHHEVGGVYREVVPNEKLVFTWAWHIDAGARIARHRTLKPDGDGTMLTLTARAILR